MIATHLRLVLQAIRLDAHRLVACRRPPAAPLAAAEVSRVPPDSVGSAPPAITPAAGTAVPIASPAPTSAAAIAMPAATSALRYLPLAGLLSGLLFSIVYVLSAQLLPHSVAVMLAIVLSAWTSGGAHELGFAGLVDELAARRRAGARHGSLRTAGLLALVLLIALKVEVLSSLDPNWISLAIVAAASLSRGLAVAVTASLPAGRPNGLPHPSPADGVVAALLGALPAAAAVWWFDYPDAFGCALVPALAVAAWLRQRQRRHLGAAATQAVHGLQQAIEVAFLIGLLAWWTLGAPAIEPVIDPDSGSE